MSEDLEKSWYVRWGVDRWTGQYLRARGWRFTYQAGPPRVSTIEDPRRQRYWSSAAAAYLAAWGLLRTAPPEDRAWLVNERNTTWKAMRWAERVAVTWWRWRNARYYLDPTEHRAE